MKSGDPCPECKKGRVYALPKSGLRIRVIAQAPLAATVYELEKLRCNLCGGVFRAEPPEGVGKSKYGARSASMIALSKYGSGLPFNRLDSLQGNLGILLPTSTQWDIVKALADRIDQIFAELIRQATQGEVVHNDDTTMKVLEYTGKRKEESDGSPQGIIEDRDLHVWNRVDEGISEDRTVFDRPKTRRREPPGRIEGSGKRA